MKPTLCGRVIARRHVAFCCSFTALVLQTHAENPSPTDSSDSAQLPTIVVTARRIEEHPVDVPAYTQIISRETIERSGTSDLIELLKNEANVNFSSLSSGPTGATISLRGTGGTDTGNGRTLITLDGVRTNRPDIGDFNWLQFPPQDIESIEVLQGPQGGYFGDNAVGGVIKINTRGYPEVTGGQINVLAGSFGTLKTSAEYSHRLENLWATVSGGHDLSDGYRNHSDYTNDFGSLRFGYDNHKNSATQIGFSYVNTRFNQPSYLTLAQYSADPKQDGGYYSDGRTKTFRLTAHNRLGDKEESQLLTDLAYFQTEEAATQRASWGDTRLNRRIDGGAFSPKAIYKINEGDLRLGVDVNFDRLNSVTSTPSEGKLHRSTVAPFLGGEVFLDEKFTLSGVIRHEFNELQADSNTPAPAQNATRSAEGDAYQVALNYKPAKTTHFYVKADHAYRFPATDEIAYYQGFGAGPLGNVFFNPKLKPERTDNYEIGVDYTLSHWGGGASLYTMSTRDEIRYNGVTFLNENIAKTKRTGIQTHLRYDKGTYGFRVRADYVDSRVTEDPVNHQTGQIPLNPKWNTNETVFVRPIKAATLSLTHRFQANSPASPASSGTVPSVSFFDAKLTVEVNRRWSAYTGVNNIADRKNISANYFGSIYPGEGRFAFLGSSFKF